MEEVNKVLKTRHRTTTAYRPQTNGMIERFHASLLLAINYLCSVTQRNWDIFLPVSLFAYRSTANSTIGMSPFHALYGFEPSMPNEIAFNVPKDGHKLDEWMKMLRQLRWEIPQIVRNHQEATQKPIDPKALYTFKQGDAVWVKKETVEAGKTRKLSSRFSGPYIVMERTSLQNYTLIHALTNKQKRVHVSKLKKAYMTEQDLTDYRTAVDKGKKKSQEKVATVKNQTAGENEEEKEEYEVEELLDHRDVKGEGRYYLVKWKEYPESKNQWLHSSRLECDDLLEDYQSIPKNKNKIYDTTFKIKVQQRRWDKRLRKSTQ